MSQLFAVLEALARQLDDQQLDYAIADETLTDIARHWSDYETWRDPSFLTDIRRDLVNAFYL